MDSVISTRRCVAVTFAILCAGIGALMLMVQPRQAIRCGCGAPAIPIDTLTEVSEVYQNVPCPEDGSDPALRGLMRNPLTGGCVGTVRYPVRQILYICPNRHQTILPVIAEPVKP